MKLRNKIRQFVGGAVAMAMALGSVGGAIPSGMLESANVSAATTSYAFDFGGSGTASGYTGISASTAYSSSTGYGFADTSSVKDVTASGTGALSDAVQFTSTDIANTFNVDLPNGLYRITVTLGNTNRTSVWAENNLQIVNMTGDNATDSILIPVTDGQLNIQATAGKEGYAYTLSALEIEYVSNATTLPSTIWFCGDSTVCNYYPLETSTQAGWGQVFSQYIDTDTWQVRNMASSGQYAKGFVESGQFDTIMNYGNSGDIFIISIGINDTNYSNETEYTEVVTDMVQQAKAKGMRVILVKQQGRAGDAFLSYTLTGRWYGTALESIAASEDVECIDLFTAFYDYCKEIGEDATYELYMDSDTLHPNRQGALVLASLAADMIFTDSGSTTDTSSEEGAVLDESITFMLRNGSSGLYLSLDGEPTNGGNVVQAACTGIDEGYTLWRAVSAGDGYYYLYSCAGDGSYLLDVSYSLAASGTNIGIYQDTGADAQLYKFLLQDDGSYIIVTKASSDVCAIEVKDASDESGANVQQWTRNSHACQTWTLEKAVQSASFNAVGDVNGDSVINVYDLVLTKQQLDGATSTRVERRAADVTQSGTVTVEDASSLQGYLLEKNGLSTTRENDAIYFAVDMAYNRGVEESSNLGYVDDAYLNLDNVTGSFVEFTVEVEKAGNYLCSFTIANGSTSNRIMKIEVNNGEDYWLQDFLTTSAWTTWEARGIVLPLVAGTNIIRLTSTTTDGGPNIDTLTLNWTDEPIAQIYEPEDDATNDDTTATSGATIYIAGDSTVQTYRASYYPQQGWGAFLEDYLDDGYTVSNHAIAGRSSKSFYDNGRLDTILESIQEGDYLLVQFAINDSASSYTERYAPVCGSVPGEEGSYEWYMAKYIEGALEKGATPILVTTTIGLKAYNSTTGLFENSYTTYCNACKMLAEYYGIPCIDLNSLMVSHYNSIGYDAAYYYHMISASDDSTDMTHFTETGAMAVAELVATELKKYLG